MALKVAQRGKVPPFIVMDVLREANRLAAAGEAVLHLEVGQPGSAAPLAVREAAKRALDCERIGYTDAFGLTDLRRAIVGHYRARYGISLDLERVVATTGSSGGFILAFLAAFEPGDVVALAAPGYPAYRNILTALGVEPLLIESSEADRFQPTPALLARAGRTGRIDGLIVASPSNPTGTMLDRAAMRALVDYCRAEGIRLVSDEIYHGITYGQEAVSALEMSDSAIVINSFSKYFCMTGWRLGWMVLPEDLLRPVECLAQNFFISPPTLSQIAALAAFDCYEQLDDIVRGYGQRRSPGGSAMDRRRRGQNGWSVRRLPCCIRSPKFWPALPSPWAGRIATARPRVPTPATPRPGCWPTSAAATSSPATPNGGATMVRAMLW